MEHPPCSSDLTPKEFCLQEINSALQGRRFQNFENIKNMTTALKAIPEQEFQKYFQHWEHRWAECIAAQGEYFEGDPSQ
jgi:hypothetical protein